LERGGDTPKLPGVAENFARASGFVAILNETRAASQKLTGKRKDFIQRISRREAGAINNAVQAADSSDCQSTILNSYAAVPK
jgi:hypothetical protein